MVDHTSNIFFFIRKNEATGECGKYQNVVCDRAFYDGWLFFYKFDYATKFTVAHRYLHLAVVSSIVAHDYLFFFPCGSDSGRVVFEKKKPSGAGAGILNLTIKPASDIQIRAINGIS